MRAYVIALVLLGAALAGTPDLAAQDPPPQPQSGDELVLTREVFSFPAFARRNPFRALLSDDERGPRFEQVDLSLILYSPERQRSVAVLSLTGEGNRGQATAQGAPQGVVQGAVTDSTMAVDVTILGQPSRRLLVGESWGNVRIVEIQREQIIVQVSEFGLQEQHVMTLANRRQGGS